MKFLADYLDDALRKPWGWGSMDCCMFAGDWVAVATGRDPMAAYRGIYSSRFQAIKLIRQRGGLLAMVDEEMRQLGFERTNTFEHGDIAVIEVPHLPGDMRAAGVSVVIRNGPWWVARSLDGIVGIDAKPLMAWGVA
jgi:hypothetical protein